MMAGKITSKTVEDKNLIESLVYLKQNNLLKESKAKYVFETVKEAENNSKEEVILTIKEKLNGLKQDISDLQKKGWEFHLEGIKLLEIPLKIRVWQSTMLKKDLESIFNLMNSVSSLIDKAKKEQEQKDIAKDKESSN